jgi:DNA-binding NarL/FixJ family response regulator
MTVRVGIADDQSMIRDGFRVQIGFAPDLELVGEASTGELAVALARTQHPDVLLMDVRMPVLDGIEATRRIVEDDRLSGVRVVMLTNYGLDEHVFRALRAGAAGFLLKDTDPASLLQALRVVTRGDALLSPSVTRQLISEFVARPPDVLSSPDLDLLTNREREVVALVAHGLSNDEIAARLHVSPLTAKTHVNRAMTKLAARDRAQLVVLAYQSGLVRAGDGEQA